MPAINFFTEDVKFKLSHPTKSASWIKRIIKQEGATLENLNFIFCSDEYLLETNKRYLKHKTYTDIITFDQSDRPGHIEGDIFISIERVRENAEKFSVSFDLELHRVLIHGVLHLLGHKDKTPKQKTLIRKKEDACLSLR
jgi:probable rRNA maturation factor